MKKIVKGNDFTLRIPVMKMVEGRPQTFPLPACTDVVVQVCNQFRRIPLAFTIDVKEDNVLLARVDGDKMSIGTYAIEVKGKIFGNDWRSNEYPQFAIVANNADADTEFGETDEGDNSVEMDTAMVILPPTVELSDLINKANETLKTNKETNDTLNANEAERKKEEESRVIAEQKRTDAERSRVEAEVSRVNAEVSRDTAEQARIDAETTRQTNEQKRVEAENQRETDFSASKKACDDATEASKTQTEACKKATDNASTQAAAAQNAANAANTSRANIEKQEAARQEAEKTRQSQETTRQDAEATRSTNETTRQSQETTRQDAENTRNSNEAARNSNEAARKTAESQRQQNTSAAITQSQTQTAIAQELNEHPMKMGDNGNWWQWNVNAHAYEDTGIMARVGVMYPTFRHTGNKLYIVDYDSNVSERVVKKGNKLLFKI